jgi:putative ABC transport system permease protein
MHGEWVFLPGRLVATLGVALAIMVVFGYSATAAALRAKAAPLLRNE